MISLQHRSEPDKRAPLANPPCPDLRRLAKQFGFRADHDPCADRLSSDPWTATLPGRRGEVFPFGVNCLAAEVQDGRVAYKLTVLLGRHALYQHGEKFWTFLFAPSLLQQ